MSEATKQMSVLMKLEHDVQTQMQKRFEKFEIHERSRNGVYRSWFCNEPGHWDCSFTITTIPAYLFVTGDLGDLVVARVYDMLPWCRRSVHSTGYFFEKISREIKKTEFSRELVEESVNERIDEINSLVENYDEDIEEYADELRTLKDVLSGGFDDNGEEYYYEQLRDVYDGCDYPDWHIYSRQVLCLREAVRWFVTHHDEPEIIQEQK